MRTRVDTSWWKSQASRVRTHMRLSFSFWKTVKLPGAGRCVGQAKDGRIGTGMSTHHCSPGGCR